MNPMGNGNPGPYGPYGQPGHPGHPGQPGQPWPGQPGQYNSATSGNVFATQRGNININSATSGQRGLRVDSKVLLIAILVDVILFFYGMLAYSGHNTSGDNWRVGIFLFMFFLTCAILGRWIRRRI